MLVQLEPIRTAATQAANAAPVLCKWQGTAENLYTTVRPPPELTPRVTPQCPHGGRGNRGQCGEVRGNAYRRGPG
jgi:hypothetical protein